ncbi:MAG TPA: hypothetical protein VLG50_05000 [Candidatus Saccharimonadales bacterium]|nr:hypothetical protein [Candidatus Saccharimonadales bacterium]
MLDDIAYEIALQANSDTLKSLCLVNQQFLTICSNPVFWKQKFPYININIKNITEYLKLLQSYEHATNLMQKLTTKFWREFKHNTYYYRHAVYKLFLNLIPDLAMRYTDDFVYYEYANDTIFSTILSKEFPYLYYAKSGNKNEPLKHITIKSLYLQSTIFLTELFYLFNDLNVNKLFHHLLDYMSSQYDIRSVNMIKKGVYGSYKK